MSNQVEIIDKAVNITDGKPAEKQPTMPGWAISALQSGEIRQMSKGVIAYECMMMADTGHSDSFTTIENKVTSSVSENLNKMLDEMVSEHVADARYNLRESCDYPEDHTETTKLQLPSEVVDEMPDYESGYHIADAVAYVYASPWTSRSERLSDVQDLVAIIRGDSVDDPSDFVQSVIDNDSAKYDVQTLHDVVEGEIEIWEQSGFDLAELKRVADDVTQNKEARPAALESALEAEDDVYSYEEIVEVAKDVYDCVPSSARNYADRVNLNSGIKIELEETAAEIADTVDQHNSLTAASIWDLIGFRGSISTDQADELSGVYTESLEFAETIATLRRCMRDSVQSEPKQIQKGHQKMTEWINAREKQGQEQLA
ncbi:hypothetical protein [Haloarcula sp. CGMCC 1.6347]|uniref:hypothetical protein n=1 Tax=Haloarcula sp. CGMCC 1.6347 TaxID=3111455 RepID=UPI00300EA1BA